MLISNRTSRLLGAGALLLAAPTLASCTSHPTDEIYTPAPGANARDSRVDVLNAVIVANEGHPGQGTLVFTLVNNEQDEPGSTTDLTDRLVGISGAVQGETKAIAIPAGEAVVVATKNHDIPQAVAPIKVTGDFELGDFVKVEFDFANAESVTLSAPVIENLSSSQFAGQNGPADEEPAAGEHAEAEGH